MKIIDKIKQHYAVESVATDSDGFWVYLKPEYISTPMECGTIHEKSWTDCWKTMKEGIKKV